MFGKMTADVSKLSTETGLIEHEPRRTRTSNQEVSHSTRKPFMQPLNIRLCAFNFSLFRVTASYPMSKSFAVEVTK